MMHRSLLGLALALAVPALARAADELKVGDPAPEFSLKGSDGKTYALSDFKGKKAVVLAWFPKAFTGGCTAECKSFKASGESLKSTNVAYFTASVDPVEGDKGNKAFAESLGLDYPILSDPEKTTAKATEARNTTARKASSAAKKSATKATAAKETAKKTADQAAQQATAAADKATS